MIGLRQESRDVWRNSFSGSLAFTFETLCLVKLLGNLTFGGGAGTGMECEGLPGRVGGAKTPGLLAGSSVVSDNNLLGNVCNT